MKVYIACYTTDLPDGVTVDNLTDLVYDREFGKASLMKVDPGWITELENEAREILEYMEADGLREITWQWGMPKRDSNDRQRLYYMGFEDGLFVVVAQIAELEIFEEA